jgi:uncharacterized protein
MRYNADIAPDPHAWLETDEADRLIAIEAFHARVRDRSPSPRLHALIHLVVENQLVMPDQEDVRETFARLRNEGLDRHEALHALGSVLAEQLLDIAKGTPRTSEATAQYHAQLTALSAAHWHAAAGADSEGGDPDLGSKQGPAPNPGAQRGVAAGALLEAELDRLAVFLSGLKNPDAMSLEALDGFLCALIAAPNFVPPSEYLRVIWGAEVPDESVFSNLEKASELLQLIMRRWNSIIGELDKTSVYLPLVQEPDERGVSGRAWARGFMRGVRLSGSAGWAELFTAESEGSLLVIPIVAGEVDPAWPPRRLSTEKGEELLANLAAGFARAYRHFAPLRQAAADAGHGRATYRRSAPKVGRNDPCPCGSGKMFKHCCGLSA